MRITPYIGFTLVITLLCFTPALAEERILDFRCAISVLEDGTLSVKETIRVTAEHEVFKRGITRDYRVPPSGRVYVTEVLRDGYPEPHHRRANRNGFRLYIGQRDALIPLGEHTYTISYEVLGAFTQFDDHDQLYWNVTGTDSTLPTDAVTAHLTWPTAVPTEDILLTAYTGKYREKGKDYTITEKSDREQIIKTTRTLAKNEGLTIVVGVTLGILSITHYGTLDARPPLAKRLAMPYGIINPRGFAWAGALGICGVLAYFLVVWLVVGIDPAKGRISPHAEPPTGVSPAALRYITRMEFDDKTFAAALLNMAAEGYLRIIPQKNRFDFARGKTRAKKLSDEGRVIAKALNLSKDGELKTLPSSGAADLRDARADLFRYMQQTYRTRYFRTNKGLWYFGAIAAVVAHGVAMNLWDGESWLFSAGMGLLIICCVIAGVEGYFEWRTLTRRVRLGMVPRSRVNITILTAGATALACFVLGLTLVSCEALLFTPWHPLVALAFGALCSVFGYLLPAPSKLGRDAIDAGEGLRQYMLGIGEGSKDGEGTIPPDTFERLLPYAVALDVEHPWTEAFTDTVNTKSVESIVQRERKRGGGAHLWWLCHHHPGFCHRFSDRTANAIGDVPVPVSSGTGTGFGGFRGGGGTFGGGGFSGGGFGGGGFSGGGFGGGGTGGW